MNKALLFVLASVATTVFAGVYDSTPQGKTEVRRHANSFFFDAFIGGTFLNYETESDNLNPYDFKDEFEGAGPAIGIKLGGMFFELISPHATLDISFAKGDRKRTDSQYFSQYDTYEWHDYEWHESVYRIFLGGGVTVFPFRNPESAMHGFYAGASLGIFAVEGSSDLLQNGSDINNEGFSVKLDLGNVWSVSDRWSIGIGYAAALDAPIVYGEDESSRLFTSLWLGAKFTRK